MGPVSLEDSTDSWKYVILLSKFLLFFVDGGITKSFGVLIPDIVDRYKSDYKTAAFVCGLPTTLMYFSVPVASFLMRATSRRSMAMFGGLLGSMTIICAPLAQSIYVLGVMLALTGFGMALIYFPVIVSINDFFAKSFIFSNTLTIFGTNFGAFLVPVIIERSVEAYGYSGGFLVLGGITFHVMLCGAVIRRPRDLKKNHAKMSSTNQSSPMMLESGSSTANTSEDLLESLKDSNENETRTTQHTKINVELSQNDTGKVNNISSSCMFAFKSFISKLKSFVLVKEPRYTLVLPAIFLESSVNAAWMLFLVPHAEGAGVPRPRAVFLSSIAGISGVLGRFVYVLLLYFNCDNVIIFGVVSAVCIFSFFVDSLSSAYAFLAITASVQGFTIFIMDCIPHAMMKLSVRDEQNMPGAIAINPFVFGLGVLAGDYVSGHIYDVTSSFTAIFITFGSITLVVVANLVVWKLLTHYSN